MQRLSQTLPNCTMADPFIIGKCLTCNSGYLSDGMSCVFHLPSAPLTVLRLIASLANTISSFSTVTALISTVKQSPIMSAINAMRVSHSTLIKFVNSVTPIVWSHLTLDAGNAMLDTSRLSLVFLVSYVCTPIDPNCTQFDSVQNVCKSCSGGKTAQGPQCV